ncbi:RNA binding motif, single stranded interacting protein 3 [Nowakowskiella sp. JEL0078]|nr:RNA binding motif, single stranded interacting protein 3 [Nowakowskiella sp. JEL0078]
MAQYFRSASPSAGFNSGPNKHQRSMSNTSTGSIGNNNTNIYIRGLKPETTDEWLYNVAKEYGTIISSKAIIDMPTNFCKGFGFVMYDSEREARHAMDGFSNMGYQVSFAKVRPSTPSFPIPVRPQYPVFSHFVPFPINQAGTETVSTVT